jgi:uncharacterized protein (DUF697 family)
MTQNANTEDKRTEASKIVRNHMLGSVAAGILPIPLLDIGILGGIQLRMVRKLASLYDVDFSEQRANAIIGSIAGISLAMTGVSFMKMIPGIGQALMGVSALTLPPASTYAIGQVFIKHFESGGTFLTFDAERAKKDYQEELENGKRVAQQNYVGVRP